jgi:hypothetical protein
MLYEYYPPSTDRTVLTTLAMSPYYTAFPFHVNAIA